jgi:hypothetical protein
MSPRSKKEYIEVILKRYKRASFKEKTLILDEFCVNCEFHRKHAIRLLRGFRRFTKPKPKKRGRSVCYDPDVLRRPLSRIWLAAKLPCSKRLKAILLLWLPGYCELFGPICPQIAKAFRTISPATLDRLLTPVRTQYQKRGRATTQPGTLLRKHIPLQTNQWDQSRAGFLEADTVAHCGESLSGMFAYTIDCVDLATGGPNREPSGAKARSASSNKSGISNHLCLSPCSASILITDPSSLTIAFPDTLRKGEKPSSLPVAEPTTRTTTPMSNRKIGPTSANGSATNA